MNTYQNKSNTARTEIEIMSIQYAIEGFEQDTPDLAAWVAQNLPNLTAVNFFQFGTDCAVSFRDGNELDYMEAVEQGIIQVELDHLKEMEGIIRDIREFEFETFGSLSKYNPHKKVFIVDLKHRVGDTLDEGVTIEALSTISCTLNDDFSFTVDPTTLGSTHASCYGGEDDWGKSKWNNVATQNAFAELTEQFDSKRGHKDVSADNFVIQLIDKLYKDSIQSNLDKLTKQAEKVALVQ